MLMDRDNFRESVFQRDNHKCVICGNGPYKGDNSDE